MTRILRSSRKTRASPNCFIQRRTASPASETGFSLAGFFPLRVSVYSASSVLLILKFVVRRAKMLSSVAIPSDVWIICFWLRLRRAVFYAAPIALRCWKHSRQNTGRPCVGRNGTVVSFPHCEQFVFVSERIGEACPPPPPPPPSARFALQFLQRFGSFLKPLSAKNICSPAVKTNSALHSEHFRTLSWYSIDGSLAPGPAWKAHTPRTMLDGEGEPIDREGRARVPRSREREAATETQQPKC